jgi:hypothetical protein
MAANECIPYFDAGEDISAEAEAAVTGKRFVDISDPQDGPANMGLDTTASGGLIQVSHAAAGGKVLGVASYDAAAGGRLYVIRGKKVLPVKAGANITAGNAVEVGTNGQAIPLASGIAVGIAVDSASSGADCPIALY